MRVVLDTNVLVAGSLCAAGPPGWILDAVLSDGLELAIDGAIRQEYEEVLRRPEFGFPTTRLDDVLDAIDRLALIVTAPPRWPVELPDRDDEPFLSVARASGSVVVNGNLRHFPARARWGVTVLSPRQFVDQLQLQAASTPPSVQEDRGRWRSTARPAAHSLRVIS